MFVLQLYLEINTAIFIRYNNTLLHNKKYFAVSTVYDYNIL